MARCERKEAPDDPEGSERWPGIYFLLAMHRTLAGEFSEPGGISIFCKGGLYHWTLRAPGINSRLMGTSASLATLMDDMEMQYRTGLATVSILRKEREAKFQERMNQT